MRKNSDSVKNEENFIFSPTSRNAKRANDSVGNHESKNITLYSSASRNASLQNDAKNDILPKDDIPPKNNIPPKNIPPKNIPPKNIPPKNIPPKNIPPKNIPPPTRNTFPRSKSEKSENFPHFKSAINKPFSSGAHHSSESHYDIYLSMQDQKIENNPNNYSGKNNSAKIYNNIDKYNDKIDQNFAASENKTYRRGLKNITYKNVSSDLILGGRSESSRINSTWSSKLDGANNTSKNAELYTSKNLENVIGHKVLGNPLNREYAESNSDSPHSSRPEGGIARALTANCGKNKEKMNNVSTSCSLHNNNSSHSNNIAKMNQKVIGSKIDTGLTPKSVRCLDNEEKVNKIKCSKIQEKRKPTITNDDKNSAKSIEAKKRLNGQNSSEDAKPDWAKLKIVSSIFDSSDESRSKIRTNGPKKSKNYVEISKITNENNPRNMRKLRSVSIPPYLDTSEHVVLEKKTEQMTHVISTNCVKNAENISKNIQKESLTEYSATKPRENDKNPPAKKPQNIQDNMSKIITNMRACHLDRNGKRIDLRLDPSHFCDDHNMDVLSVKKIDKNIAKNSDKNSVKNADKSPVKATEKNVHTIVTKSLQKTAQKNVKKNVEQNVEKNVQKRMDKLSTNGLTPGAKEISPKNEGNNFQSKIIAYKTSNKHEQIDGKNSVNVKRYTENQDEYFRKNSPQINTFPATPTECDFRLLHHLEEDIKKPIQRFSEKACENSSKHSRSLDLPQLESCPTRMVASQLNGAFNLVESSNKLKKIHEKTLCERLAINERILYSVQTHLLQTCTNEICKKGVRNLCEINGKLLRKNNLNIKKIHKRNHLLTCILQYIPRLCSGIQAYMRAVDCLWGDLGGDTKSPNVEEYREKIKENCEKNREKSPKKNETNCKQIEENSDQINQNVQQTKYLENPRARNARHAAKNQLNYVEKYLNNVVEELEILFPPLFDKLNILGSGKDLSPEAFASLFGPEKVRGACGENKANNSEKIDENRAENPKKRGEQSRKNSQKWDEDCCRTDGQTDRSQKRNSHDEPSHKYFETQKILQKYPPPKKSNKNSTPSDRRSPASSSGEMDQERGGTDHASEGEEKRGEKMGGTKIGKKVSKKTEEKIDQKIDKIRHGENYFCDERNRLGESREKNEKSEQKKGGKIEKAQKYNHQKELSPQKRGGQVVSPNGKAILPVSGKSDEIKKEKTGRKSPENCKKQQENIMQQYDKIGQRISLGHRKCEGCKRPPTYYEGENPENCGINEENDQKYEYFEKMRTHPSSPTVMRSAFPASSAVGQQKNEQTNEQKNDEKKDKKTDKKNPKILERSSGCSVSQTSSESVPSGQGRSRKRGNSLPKISKNYGGDQDFDERRLPEGENFEGRRLLRENRIEKCDDISGEKKYIGTCSGNSDNDKKNSSNNYRKISETNYRKMSENNYQKISENDGGRLMVDIGNREVMQDTPKKLGENNVEKKFKAELNFCDMADIGQYKQSLSFESLELRNRAIYKEACVEEKPQDDRSRVRNEEKSEQNYVEKSEKNCVEKYPHKFGVNYQAGERLCDNVYGEVKKCRTKCVERNKNCEKNRISEEICDENTVRGIDESDKIRRLNTRILRSQSSRTTSPKSAKNATQNIAAEKSVERQKNVGRRTAGLCGDGVNWEKSLGVTGGYPRKEENCFRKGGKGGDKIAKNGENLYAVRDTTYEQLDNKQYGEKLTKYVGKTPKYETQPPKSEQQPPKYETQTKTQYHSSNEIDSEDESDDQTDFFPTQNVRSSKSHDKFRSLLCSAGKANLDIQNLPPSSYLCGTGQPEEYPQN